MVSLILGLGGELFEPLKQFGLNSQDIAYVKASLFLPSIVWSLYLGDRILCNQGVVARYRWIPLFPSVMGSLILALAWWPALF
jgi:hypothetical protein